MQYLSNRRWKIYFECTRLKTMSCTMISMLLDAIDISFHRSFYRATDFLCVAHFCITCSQETAKNHSTSLSWRHQDHYNADYLDWNILYFLYTFLWLYHISGFYSRSFQIVIRVLRGTARVRVMGDYVSTGLTCRYFSYLKKFRKTQMRPPHGTKSEPYIWGWIKYEYVFNSWCKRLKCSWMQCDKDVRINYF